MEIAKKKVKTAFISVFYVSLQSKYVSIKLGLTGFVCQPLFFRGIKRQQNTVKVR